MEKSKKNSVVEKSSSPLKSADGMITIELQHLLTPLAILFSGFMIALVLFFGFRDLSGGSVTKSNGSDTTTTTTGSGSTTGDSADAGTFSEASTTIDDDPYKGNKDEAKVAIVEFSDFQCPFCKRAFEQTYPDIIKNYVDTGKAIYVFRDYPLSFHPLAKPAAAAGTCVFKELGRDKFFEYHDKVFANDLTTQDQIDSAATSVGMNADELKNCASNSDTLAEVDADMSAGSDAGVTGTPGFVIGKLDDNGKVTGKLVGGAYPYDTFETIIEEYL